VTCGVLGMFCVSFLGKGDLGGCTWFWLFLLALVACDEPHRKLPLLEACGRLVEGQWDKGLGCSHNVPVQSGVRVAVM
jgi:hypothetical protein